jgi:hypothetical protein
MAAICKDDPELDKLMKEQGSLICKDCKIYTRPDYHHCDICDVCVRGNKRVDCSKFDLHRTNIGICVGDVNLKYYLLLEFYAFMQCLFMCFYLQQPDT